MNLAALFLPVLILVGGPAPAQAPPPAKAGGEAAATMEWRGQYGGDVEAGAEVLMHAGRWEGLWRSLGQGPHPLDFTKYCAVVAYAGQRPTGGFTLEFLEPVPQGNDLLIRWRVRSPSPDSFTTQALAQPWKVKAFPRPKGQVKLEQLKD